MYGFDQGGDVAFVGFQPMSYCENPIYLLCDEGLEGGLEASREAFLVSDSQQIVTVIIVEPDFHIKVKI